MSNTFRWLRRMVNNICPSVRLKPTNGLPSRSRCSIYSLRCWIDWFQSYGLYIGDPSLDGVGIEARQDANGFPQPFRRQVQDAFVGDRLGDRQHLAETARRRVQIGSDVQQDQALAKRRVQVHLAERAAAPNDVLERAPDPLRARAGGAELSHLEARAHG